MRPGKLRQRLLDVCAKANKKYAYVTVVGVSYLASGSGSERFEVKERYCKDTEDAKDSIGDIQDHSVTFFEF